MKPEILVPGELPPREIARLRETFTLHHVPSYAQADEELAKLGSSVRAIAARAIVGANAVVMAALPKLEMIAIYGVGIDKVDLAAAKSRGIKVANTPDVLTQDTADFAVILMLALSRRLVESDRFIRAGQWTQGIFPSSTSVRGKNLGIVGMGRIGQTVARRAEAFGMKIHWQGPRAKPQLPYQYVAGVEDLAAAVDYLVLTCPASPETDNLVDADVLAALGPKGMLINISRGSVVNEAALIAALEAKTIAGAALDVFQGEPKINPAFIGMENVVLAPHIASATTETRNAIGDLMFANIKAHFDGQALPSQVV